MTRWGIFWPMHQNQLAMEDPTRGSSPQQHGAVHHNKVFSFSLFLFFSVEQDRLYFSWGFELPLVTCMYKSTVSVQSVTAKRIISNSRTHPSTSLHSPSRGERWWFWVLERKLNNDSLYWQTRENQYHMSEKVIFAAFTWVVSFRHITLYDSMYNERISSFLCWFADPNFCF